MTADPKTLFDKPMRSGIRSVDPAHLQEALARWHPHRGYSSLASWLRYLLGDEARQINCHRIADRMIQKMRKAGVIRHLGGGKWEWVE